MHITGCRSHGIVDAIQNLILPNVVAANLFVLLLVGVAVCACFVLLALAYISLMQCDWGFTETQCCE